MFRISISSYVSQTNKHFDPLSSEKHIRQHVIWIPICFTANLRESVASNRQQMSFVVTGAKLLVIHSTMRWPVRLAGDSQLAFQSQTAGPDLENAKRGVPEQAGVQGTRE